MDKQILHTPNANIMETSSIGKLIAKINMKKNQNITTYNQLHDYSINNMDDFYDVAINDLGIIFTNLGNTTVANPDKMTGGQFFVDSTLNFAQNLLKKTGDDDCLVYRTEDKINTRHSWNDIHSEVSKMQQALSQMGVLKGDVVAGFVPNCPQAVIAMLATTSLGGVWTSASPDFGVDGVLDRFGQTEPKVLICADGYYYNGKYHDSINKVSELNEKIDSIKNVIVFNHTENFSPDNINGFSSWTELTEKYDSKPIEYTPVAFNHPVFIMYSSGTTGQPKCIVHGVGGTLLAIMIEGKYHSEIVDGSRAFFYSTCGWMMWNWLVGNMANGSTILLYDGSPFIPNQTALFDYMDDEKATFMGISAKYIDFLMKTDVCPIKNNNLDNLQTVGSTGSVLSPEAFEWIATNVKQNVYISSLSGGTDILGCFLMGNPITPVTCGELVAPVLGKAVEIWDDNGKDVVSGTGELMCVKPFPSMPIYFYNDTNGSKYRGAYFEKFDGVWCHGDFVERTSTGYIIQGRSDSVLNPGGVRIGTAEIYRQVESFADVVESVVIGQPFDNDVRVILFVKMADGKKLTDELITEIKQQIKVRCTPRHIPAKIIAIGDIPRTRSGKISEIAVRDMVMGREVKNKTALANSECLDMYKDIEELQS